MIAAAQYSTAAEMMAAAKARHQRLMRPANAFKPSRAAVVLKMVERVPEAPMWQSQAIQFDDHVRTWQWHIAKVNSNRYKEYIQKRCTELGADYLQVIGRAQTRDVTGHRQLIMYELKTKYGLSYPRIGREFSKDHTSVISAVSRIAKIRGEAKPEYVTGEERLLNDPKTKAEIKALYATGTSLEDLSIRFEISERAIVAVAKTENWYKPDRRTVGLRAFKTLKLNMAVIRKDYEGGMKRKDICLKHDLSDRTLGRLINEYSIERAG